MSVASTVNCRKDCHDRTLPAPARPAGPGLHHPEEPHPDGLHAHRPGREAQRLRAHGGLFRRARPRRRRLDGHRRHRPERGGRGVLRRRQAEHPGRSREAPHRHPGRARSGRQDLHADPPCRSLRLQPQAGRTERHPGADQPVQTARTGRGRHREADQRLRELRPSCPAGRVRRVEIMGSEGYFINQFLVAHTNQRTDRWGGSYENRMRLPVEIVRRVREAVGPNFIIIYRLSMLDLVEGGSTWDEIVTLAKAIEPPAPPSSTPASAGTRRASRPSPPRCRARPSPRSPPSSRAR